MPEELTSASRLGVSRGTVRNSIPKLVHQGLLERRKGVVDADGHPSDYAEIYYHTGEISLTLTSPLGAGGLAATLDRGR